MSVQLSYLPYSLLFKHPFGLSYGSRMSTEVIYVKLRSEEAEGYGEAALPPYVLEKTETVIGFFEKAARFFNRCSSSTSISQLMESVNRISDGNTAAKAAIDMALFDLQGKLLKQPSYRLLGLEKPVAKPTSVTISIGDFELIPNKLREWDDYSIIKVKLGTRDDQKLLETIRLHTSKPIVVDVNQGWKDKYFAREMIAWLSDKNVLFIEQPLAKDRLKDTAWLSAHSSIPILADESMQGFKDLSEIADCFGGINLKLMKCGGLLEAMKIINFAKRRHLKINIGCMSESSCGIAAAAQIMNEADWIDLDGPLLITNNPFAGVRFSSGKLNLLESDGTGAIWLNPLDSFLEFKS